jgi:ABC-2 type transport system permease protein
VTTAPDTIDEVDAPDAPNAVNARRADAGRTAARLAHILAASARMQILVIRSHPVVPLLTVVQPTVIYLVVSSGQTASTTAQQRAALLIATLLTSLWGVTLWAAGGVLRREIFEGTLARNLTSVTDSRLVLLGKCFGSTCLAFGLLVCTGVVLGLVEDVRVRPGILPWLVLGLCVVTVSGTVMGFVLSGVFVLTRHAIHVTAALSYPVYIFGGLLIPTALLPVWLGWISRLVSLFWANQFLDSVVDTGRPRPGDLALCVLLTAAYYAAGHLLFARIIRRARVRGTIDLG